MEIGKDYIEGPEDSPHPNRWPESLPEFKAFMVSSALSYSGRASFVSRLSIA